MVDIMTENLGTLVTFAPMTEAGNDWLLDNCEWEGGSLVADSRYACEIIVGAIEDGLVVQDVDTGRLGVVPS